MYLYGTNGCHPDGGDIMFEQVDINKSDFEIYKLFVIQKQSDPESILNETDGTIVWQARDVKSMSRTARYVRTVIR